MWSNHLSIRSRMTRGNVWIFVYCLVSGWQISLSSLGTMAFYTGSRTTSFPDVNGASVPHPSPKVSGNIAEDGMRQWKSQRADWCGKLTSRHGMTAAFSYSKQPWLPAEGWVCQQLIIKNKGLMSPHPSIRMSVQTMRDARGRDIFFSSGEWHMFLWLNSHP